MRLRAELKWDTTTIKLAPTVFDATAEADFKFVNAGNKAVSIESVQPSCECTVAKLEKKRYAPGERGEILAHFDIGDRKGTQNVTIQITIDGQREPVTLSLTVKIPASARIDPASLLWAIGEPNTPKTVTVEAVAGQPLRVEKVLASNADFDTRLETIREDAEYHIVVTPKSTDHPMITLLNIDARLNDRPKALLATAQVRVKSSIPAATSGPPAARPPPIAPVLEPQLVAWVLGETPGPKTVSIRAPANQRLRISKAVTAAANFQVKLETIHDESEYRLTITPVSTEAASLAIVSLETADEPAGPPLRVYAQVRSAVAPAKIQGP